MTDLSPPPIGPNKAWAALAVGAFVTGIVALANQYLPHAIPQSTVNGCQALVTFAAVYWTPHGG